jgi:uncharacterized surface protein with fasciclin (FAS1) repeats
VLSYHVAEGSFTLAELGALGSLPTVHGESLTITVEGNVVRVDGSAALPPELSARNGIIIPIDAVLVPQITAVPF